MKLGLNKSSFLLKFITLQKLFTMNGSTQIWQQLDVQFRELVKKFYSLELVIFKRLLEKSYYADELNTIKTLIDNNIRYIKACENTEDFISTWKKEISGPRSKVKNIVSGGIITSENYLELASELAKHSSAYKSMSELINSSTFWTRTFIANHRPFFDCSSLREFEDILENILTGIPDLVIDHAFYALYIAWKPDSVVLVKDNNKELLKAVHNDSSILHVISPRRFEEIIAYLYECAGCKVQLTKETRDWGADILAWHGGPLNSEVLTAIQVKKYKQGRNLGLKDIYELHGAITHYNADLGHIITSSDFTSSAKQFSDLNKIHYLNLADLQKEIQNLIK